jgi:hypothetical protein
VYDAIDQQLAAQAHSLRMVALSVSRAHARLPCVVPGPEWIGPASTAYQDAVDRLRIQLAVVDDRLDAAVSCTLRAMATRGGR